MKACHSAEPLIIFLWFTAFSHFLSFSFRYAEKAEQLRLENDKENIEAKIAYNTAASRDASPFILISALYKHISDKSKTVLLMDCRLAEAYQESKINFSNMINIPEESIRAGYVHCQ